MEFNIVVIDNNIKYCLFSYLANAHKINNDIVFGIISKNHNFIWIKKILNSFKGEVYFIINRNLPKDFYFEVIRNVQLFLEVSVIINFLSII